ncbi:hypothetical protein RCL1_006466 [Eukaryota sp. TZLM3-RCL]
MIELLLLLLALSAAFKISVSRPLSFVETFNNSADDYHIVSLPSFEPSSLDFVLFTGFVSDVGLSFQHFLLIHHVSLISSRSFLLSSQSACFFEDARFSLESSIFPNNQFTLSHLVTSLSDFSTDLILIAYDFLLNQTSFEYNELSLKIYSFLNYKSGKSFDNVVENELISIEIPSFSAENPNIHANISITHHSNSCNSSFPHLISFLSSVSLPFCISTTGNVADDSVISIPPLNENYQLDGLSCYFNKGSTSFLLTLTDYSLKIINLIHNTVLSKVTLFSNVRAITPISLESPFSTFVVVICEENSCILRLLQIDFSDADFEVVFQVISVQAARHHSLVLFSDGTLKTFGRGSYGRLGDGVGTTSHVARYPVTVVDGHDFVAVSSLSIHTVALTRSGHVYTFGVNGYSQLGDPVADFRSRPFHVASLTNVVSVSAGDHHSLALLANGTVMAWGRSTTGRLGRPQLGLGTVAEPIKVLNLDDAVEIVAGLAHTLAIKSDGTVVGCGAGGGGRLGYGGISQQNYVVPAQNIEDAVAISTGRGHTLVLTSHGSLWVVGLNTFGQLGLGDYEDRLVAELLNCNIPDAHFVAVSATLDSSMVLLSNGRVMVFGRNNWGHFMDGSTSDSFIPILIEGLYNIKHISIGETHSLAASVYNTTVYAGGSNTHGQISGTESYFWRPKKVERLV